MSSKLDETKIGRQLTQRLTVCTHYLSLARWGLHYRGKTGRWPHFGTQWFNTSVVEYSSARATGGRRFWVCKSALDLPQEWSTSHAPTPRLLDSHQAEEMCLSGQTQILFSPREITQLISGELLYHKESERWTTSLPYTGPIKICLTLPSAVIEPPY